MDFSQLNIKIPSGATGNIKTVCPACTPHNRKPENRNSKDLSVNVNEGVYQCHNCGWKGSVKAKQEKVYFRPPEVLLDMSQRAIDYFAARGIKPNTLKFFGITEKIEFMPQEGKEVNCILFPYRRNRQWVNIKYRDAKKNFKMVKDAELILFNLDAITGQKQAIITEGEVDCLSAHQVGFMECVSVPNGASKGNQRLDYLDNCWSAFSECEKIFIATDRDEPGVALKNELSRRLGRDRCLEVKYPPDCKDLNEVLVKHGERHVWDCIKYSLPFPVEGIMKLTDFESELDQVYEHGFPKGADTGYAEFDGLLNFSEGQLTTITGIPNSGKSAFTDQITINLTERHQWNWGICSFENQPVTKHAANLIQCYIGERFYGAEKMGRDAYLRGKIFLDRHYFWFKMKDEDLTIDGIIRRGIMLVKTHGIKGLLIDPYNYIESKRAAGQSETDYISEVLSKLCNFAKNYGCHVFLIAHPTKIKKNLATKDFEVPTLYDISGSANFFNKTDNGITVYRERATNKTVVYVQKVRFFFNGKIGYADFNYDVYTGRYSPANEEVAYEPPVNHHKTMQQAAINNRILGEGEDNNVFKEPPF